MLLSIRVVTYKSQPPDTPLSMTFDEQGGGIGRLPAPENRLQLPDPDKYISRRHAHIKCEGGAFFLTDMSTGGTFCINKNRSVHHDSLRLEDGDRLRIGDYELVVSLTATPGAGAPAPDLPPGANEGRFFDSGTTNSPAADIPAADAFTWPERHPLDAPVERESFVPPAVEPPAATNGIPADFDINQLLSDKEDTQPPTAVEPAGSGQNEGPFPGADGWPNRGTLPAEEKAPAPPTPARPSGAAAGKERRLRKAIGNTARPSIPATTPLLEVFLDAAGLKKEDLLPAEAPEETMRTLGILVRELIGGLMTTLQARSELKSQFRVSMTVIQPVENNPLKFSARSEDALKQLLQREDSAFLDPATAVQEAFEDIGNHQLALAAGIQSSLMALLQRFDPAHFEKRFERGLAIQRQAKSWNAYRDDYEGLVKEAMDDIFGAAFSRAYERQIQQLRSGRKTRS